jgi:Amt family ammonium transporter
MNLTTGVSAGLLVCVLMAGVCWAQGEEATTPAAAAAAEEKPTDPLVGAQEDIKTIKRSIVDKSIALDTVWVMVAGFLVMWMQAGFALVETGLTRAKNAVNICMKNLLDYCFGTLAFWAVGFGMMFGVDNGMGIIGTTGFFASGANDVLVEQKKDGVVQTDPDGKPIMESAVYPGLNWTRVPLEAKFFFQLVFAATAATIVSGAMAERTKFVSYMAYSFIISLCIYPVSGHWIWGGGWLAQMGFWDFAGSTVVHSLGGWLSLAGALVLGARTGKYGTDGKVNAIPGHNLVLVCLGVFILWLGWFGFNPGSTMMADPVAIAKITVVTNAAGAIGGIAALVTAKIMFKKWEATMALNGVLAGLVAITAPCAWIDIGPAFIVGLLAGILVVLSVVFFDQVVKVDDPVGAISVHGVCGAFGTLCVGLFSNGTGEGGLSPLPGLFTGGGADQLIKQLIGVGSMMAWGLATGFACFLLLKYTIGLRVTKEEEQEGLDFGEHGNEAYHGFQFTD